ncbi:VOC family protein [Amycolatopsis minnesotensis]|uniref:VOC family protein n=1 Tax=Amycolatopsis minnesotensis TaxID=337894 RepID=A0ABP5D3Z9_9PSEU
MATRLNPYLSFTDDARQAMEFYREVFGGTLTLNTFGESGAPDESIKDNIMHAMLETTSGFILMASDTPPGMAHNPGSAISISLSGDDDEELRGYWAKLSEGGRIDVPLEKQMWGAEFGMCADRFGIVWMVNIG